MSIIYDRLQAYSHSDYYGFHMPGHKRNAQMMDISLPYEMDITEIEGFDDLHHPSGMIKEAQNRAARLYHAQESHFLINGSTAGILSAVLGVTQKGDTVLVARNCHKSVYHAIYMNALHPVYLHPAFHKDVLLHTEILAKDVKDALEKHPHIRAVIIVSPTYDGVVSDVRAIAKVVHDRHIPLIVDEAHGAHFGFHPFFPSNANQNHADIVIHSLHKTLPSLTQTALLHMNGELADRERVRRYLHMLQSSSPSYILMASMDHCMDMLERKGSQLFERFAALLRELRGRLDGLQCISLIETEHFDRSKLVLSVRGTGLTGKELYGILLREYHLQMEMAAGSYVLAMTTIGDRGEGFDRLSEALAEIDKKLRRERQPKGEMVIPGNVLPDPRVVYTSARMDELLYEAGRDGSLEESLRQVSWEESIGFISTEYAYLYPPGSPLIVPGEKISKEAANMLQWYDKQDFKVEGLKKKGCIEVWTHG